jgi:hypothetical protein
LQQKKDFSNCCLVPFKNNFLLSHGLRGTDNFTAYRVS